MVWGAGPPYRPGRPARFFFAVADNAALGDSSAVRAATLASYDAAASGTGGAGVTTFASALADPIALGSDVDQSTTRSLDSSSADFLQAVKQVPSSKDPINFIAVAPGLWRGAGDRIDGLRKCENGLRRWPEACIGGSITGSYCRAGHGGPLCAPETRVFTEKLEPVNREQHGD